MYMNIKNGVNDLRLKCSRFFIAKYGIITKPISVRYLKFINESPNIIVIKLLCCVKNIYGI